MIKSRKKLLLEIGTEDLPPKDLRSIAESFLENVITELNNSRLVYDKVEWFATSRRLALTVINLSSFQLDLKLKKQSPTFFKVFDKNGKLNKEAEIWINKYSINIDQTELLITREGESLMFYYTIKGKNTEYILPNIVVNSLKRLSVSKTMRWGSGKLCFIRPVNTITVLFGEKLISTTVFGIKSGRYIQGHRFMGESKLFLDNADQYPQILLERGKVIANYEQRKNKIKIDIEKVIRKINGKVNFKNSFLEEIVSLVEWPVVLVAKFKEKFLSIPIEILIYILENYKKYFPIYTKDGKLLSSFIFVVNIESEDPQKIIYDNEKTINSILKDIKIFIKNDRKQSLENYLLKLNTVIFQKQLGTLLDKTNRIKALAGWIAEQIGANVNNSIRAGLLSKCDLITNMVFEFSDVQGIIGMYYARCDGETEEVAIALKEQYNPRFADDKIPSNKVACTLAIADKIDTIVGIFSIGKLPKGNKDSFALRRYALGILRIIIGNNLNLDVKKLINESLSLYSKNIKNVELENNIFDFILGRLDFWYQKKGYKFDIIQAVLKCRPTNPSDCNIRVNTLSYFYQEELSSLSLLVKTNKRVINILNRTNESINEDINYNLLSEEYEIKLVDNITILDKKMHLYIDEKNYKDMLFELFSICKLVNAFFDNVMINVNNRNIRINRLTLLFKLRKIFLQIADFSLLQ